MVATLVFSQRGLIAVVWLFLRRSGLGPAQPTTARPQASKRRLPPRRRSKEPQPLRGLTHKPHGEAGAQGVAWRREPPWAPPPPLVSTRSRRPSVDTAHQCWPDPAWREGGWRGRGTMRSHGHPSGGPWRQRYGSRCQGDVLATQGTLFQGTRVAVESRVRGMACLAAGLGLRGPGVRARSHPRVGLVGGGSGAPAGLCAVCAARSPPHARATGRPVCRAQGRQGRRTQRGPGHRAPVPRAPGGVDGDGPREHMVPGHGGWPAHPGPGPGWGASGCPAVGP
jgi:hypothetical protein